MIKWVAYWLIISAVKKMQRFWNFVSQIQRKLLLPYYYLFGAGFLAFKDKKEKKQKFLSLLHGRVGIFFFFFFKSQIIRFMAHGDMKLLPGAINSTNRISLCFLMS